jgi:hypothetical protein
MELLESGPPKTLFHYTNWDGFNGILKSGYIRPQKYEIGTQDLKSSIKEKWKQRGEIATIRPSQASTREMGLITGGAGGFRFAIRADVLKDKQRQVKVRPIAEFPLDAIKKLKDGFVHRRHKNPPFTEDEAEKFTNKSFLFKILLASI